MFSKVINWLLMRDVGKNRFRNYFISLICLLCNIGYFLALTNELYALRIIVFLISTYLLDRLLKGMYKILYNIEDSSKYLMFERLWKLVIVYLVFVLFLNLTIIITTTGVYEDYSLYVGLLFGSVFVYTGQLYVCKLRGIRFDLLNFPYYLFQIIILIVLPVVIVCAWFTVFIVVLGVGFMLGSSLGNALGLLMFIGFILGGGSPYSIIVGGHLQLLVVYTFAKFSKVDELIKDDIIKDESDSSQILGDSVQETDRGSSNTIG